MICYFRLEIVNRLQTLYIFKGYLFILFVFFVDLDVQSTFKM
jgi:hypothetical protein